MTDYTPKNTREPQLYPFTVSDPVPPRYSPSNLPPPLLPSRQTLEFLEHLLRQPSVALEQRIAEETQ